MIRKAFKMKIYPDKIGEYTKRHNPIWKELYDVLKSSGVHNYSIYFDPQTNNLFGYAEIESEENGVPFLILKFAKNGGNI